MSNISTAFHEELQTEKLKEKLSKAEILLCDGDALLSCLKADAVPNLKWAQSTWAGTNYYHVFKIKEWYIFFLFFFFFFFLPLHKFCDGVL